VLLDTHSPNAFQQNRFVLPEMREKRSARKNKQPQRCEFSGLRFRRPLIFRKESRPFSVAKAHAGESWRSQDRGERRVIVWSETKWARDEWDIKVRHCVREFNPKVAGK